MTDLDALTVVLRAVLLLAVLPLAGCAGGPGPSWPPAWPRDFISAAKADCLLGELGPCQSLMGGGFGRVVVP